MDFIDEELQTQHLFLVKRICRVCNEEKDLVADFYKCRRNPTLESSVPPKIFGLLFSKL